MFETKRNYHPLIILLFVSGMLSLEEISQIPNTTKHNWGQFKHENYFGYEWVEKYIDQLNDIKDVFKSKFTFRALKTILQARRGYYNMLGEIVSNKNLLKKKCRNYCKSNSRHRSVFRSNHKQSV